MIRSVPDGYTLSAATQAFLARTHGLLIGGEEVAALGGARLAVVDPASGDALTEVASGAAADIDRAVLAARAAFEDPSWRAMRPAERERLIHRFADLIEANAVFLSEIECLDNGKSRRLAERVDVAGGVGFLRYMAGWPTKLVGETLPVSFPRPREGDYTAYTRREPIGVVGAIVPWNFPLLMAIWKIGPALAAGCTIVLKPAEDTPLTALALGRLALEAGIPPGVLNIVPGRGDEAGAALASHPGIAKIAFTGSTQVGRMVGKAALDNLTRVTLELGGKSPAIILPDAPMKKISSGAANAIFYNHGQVCCAASRLYVHSSRFDETVDAVAQAAGKYSLGGGFDDSATMGPLISEKQRTRVSEMVGRARAAGAQVVTGGAAPDREGFYYQPTVLTNLEPEMEIVQEEVFGPVLACLSFDEIDEVIEAANATAYGLAASVWTNDLAAVHRIVPRLRAGTVWVNCHNLLDPAMPFGGVGLSGMGREMGREVVEHYTEVKSVCILA